MKERVEKILEDFTDQRLCYDASKNPIGLATNSYEIIKELWIENQKPKWGWLPIKTAPKDGTDILAAKLDNSTQQWECRIVYWTNNYGDNYKWQQRNNAGSDDLFPADYFTHYLVLQPPSKEK